MFLSDNPTFPEKDNTNYYQIPSLSVSASAGSGITNYEIEVLDYIQIPKTFFKTPKNPKDLNIIQVSGDSMSPTLNDGDYIVVDTKKKGIIDGIYALNINGEVFVKRLQFNLDGTIKIISDNPKYDPQIYNPNDDNQIHFEIIGKTVLTIRG